MGCKSSAIRPEGSTGSSTPEPHKGRGSPNPAAADATLADKRAKGSASPPPTAAKASPRGSIHDLTVRPAGPRRGSRDSIPVSPRRSSADTRQDDGDSSGSGGRKQRETVRYAQDDDPFAPPPPLEPEAASGSDCASSTHAHSTTTNHSGSDVDRNDDDGAGSRPEHHFDPIPMPAPAVVAAQRGEGRGWAAEQPQGRSPAEAKPATTATPAAAFRTPISERDKTDSAQAAKEYQQRMEAKRTAEEVHTKRRRLEEFDPVRPIDSFNVTHRGLLGRCWDRRAPELIPVSFVHAIATVLDLQESHPASTPTGGNVAGGGDDFPPGSPVQHLSRLSRQSGPRCCASASPTPGSGTHASTAAAAGTRPAWTGVGGRRVPRRSHWFSVGALSTEGMAVPGASSPTGAEPFYIVSPVSSPVAQRPTPALSFPASAAAVMVGGRLGMGPHAMHIMLPPPTTAAETAARASPKRASTGAAANAEDAVDSFGTKTLTPEQVTALPWETRERYFNIMMSHNPRFMGIKDAFAFRLGSGVSDDRSVKFLRKRNLEPAPGVTAVRWNRVEFFHPSLHTLVRAVSKTQGMSVELRQVEQASGRAVAGGELAAAAIREGSSGTASSGVHANASMAARGAAGSGAVGEDVLNATSADLLHRSFSQFVMGHAENRSFAEAESGGHGGGAGGTNASFLLTPSRGDKKNATAVAAGGHEKAAAAAPASGGTGSFLMGLHRNRAKEAEGGSGAEALRFPEDSVLALALGMHFSRLSLLAGVPPAVRNAALSNAGRLSNPFLFPGGIAGLGSRKASRDTLSGPGTNFSSPRGGGVGGGGGGSGSGVLAPLMANADTALVSLSVSCFSVSINPFEWQERHYIRYPVDIDGSKRSSRSSYGEGVITDVMYGGLMVVECSSVQAVKELQSLLASMAWTEERSLQGIVKDVRKHLKTVHANLQKTRQAAAAAAAKRVGDTASNAGGGGAGGKSGVEEAAAKDWSAHRYRIIRRIGGRPMRDAVELEEISVFFNQDEELREQRTTLRPGDAVKKAPGPGNEGRATGGSRPPSMLDLEQSLSESARPPVSRSSPNSPDPDITSSFSRVASAWLGLPVIAAVLRSWGLHLLSCPEYAQPTSLFLQKHAGLAPVLQLTALGSFYHEGNTPSDENGALEGPDDLFFETDGAPDAEPHDAEAAALPRAHSTRHISKFNRFYASQPPSPASTVDGDHHSTHSAIRRHRHSGHHDDTAEDDDDCDSIRSGRAVGGGGGGGGGGGRSWGRSSRHHTSTAASSPAHNKASTASLDGLHAEHSHEHSGNDSFDRRPQRRDTARMSRCDGEGREAPRDDEAEEEKRAARGLGPKSYSKETVVGEGPMHAADGESHDHGSRGAATAGMRERQSSRGTLALSTSQNSNGTAVGDERGLAPPRGPEAKNKGGGKGDSALTSSAAKAGKEGEGSSSASATAAAAAAAETAAKPTAAPPTNAKAALTVSGRPPRRVDATRPNSRCNSPISPGKATAPNSRRHNASPTLSATSSSASFFDAASTDRRERQTTTVFKSQRGSTSVTTDASASFCRPGREPTEKIARSDTSTLVAVPQASTEDELGFSYDGASVLTADAKSQLPQLFMPSPTTAFDSDRQDLSAVELVAMAKTVGPEESLAAQEAQRRAKAGTREKTPLQSPLSPHGKGAGGRKKVSNPSSSTTCTAPAAGAAVVVSLSEDSEEASPVSTKSSVVVPTPKASSEGSTKGKAKKVKKGVTAAAKPKKPARGASAEDSGSEHHPAPAAASSSSATQQSPKGKKGRGSDAAAPAHATTALTLPISSDNIATTTTTTATPAAVLDPTESQACVMGTPTGVSNTIHSFGTPTGVPQAHGAVFPIDTAAVAAAAADLPNLPHRVTEEEAEGLWYMAMLELKAQQQELEELRQTRANAEEKRQKQQDELRALNRVFLPHTAPQELDCTLLYLKTVLYEPDDIPHGRLYLQQPDWLPLLAAVWTSPANRIRSVEVAAELTWVDIPRIGLLAGLLYHHNAAGSLDELILRSDKLLGGPRQLRPSRSGDDAVGLVLEGDKKAKKKKKSKQKKDALQDTLNASTNSLNFVTELDCTSTGFGPGCPPFFIAPEEARDTLWLLLCAVATNTATPNFRVVLKGIPTPEGGSPGGVGAGGSGGSGGAAVEHERTASHLFSSFFATRRREERPSEPLLLNPRSMLLDSFVVQPTLHDAADADGEREHELHNYTMTSERRTPKRAGMTAGKTGNGQAVSRTNTLDETGFIASANNSLPADSFVAAVAAGGGRPAMDSPLHGSPDISRQLSSLLIVTSSAAGLAASPGPLGPDDPLEGTTTAAAGAGSFSPNPQHRRSLSTLMTLRSHAGFGRSSPPPKPKQLLVPTHQHHVKRRPWLHEGAEVEERPFYEVLMHRCGPIEEARIAAANSNDPSLLAMPYVSHYHHPYNATHNDARFYVSLHRQAEMQAAVRRAAAVANGEATPRDYESTAEVYASKPQHLSSSSAAQQQKQQQEEAEERNGTVESPLPRAPVPCPPPLPFHESCNVFGLPSAEEEARVLRYEEAELRDRAVDIWEALRKSVKHYNLAQQEARNKALKSDSKTVSPPPPAKMITLEH